MTRQDTIVSMIEATGFETVSSLAEALDVNVSTIRRDLEHLADACREKGISLCLDFVMNHTSEDHQWARKARAGEPGYRERYFFYDNWEIPQEFEKTVPQVFPTTAPGSFTWLDDCKQVVMTNFYPYQWDLNYANPVVFNDMTENLLYLPTGAST